MTVDDTTAATPPAVTKRSAPSSSNSTVMHCLHPFPARVRSAKNKMAARNSVAAIAHFTHTRSIGRCQRAHHQRVLIERVIITVMSSGERTTRQERSGA